MAKSSFIVRKDAAEEGKPIRYDSINGAILATLLLGQMTLDEIAEKAKVPTCKAAPKIETQSRIWGIWKHNGIGYAVDESGRYKAVLPANLNKKTVFTAGSLPPVSGRRKASTTVKGRTPTTARKPHKKTPQKKAVNKKANTA